VSVKDQPVSKVRWVPREKLVGNAWNPNRVASPELELLITSLVEDGWTQPVVVLPADEDGMHVIVDGFHRWTVSGDARVAALTGGMVPVVTVRLDPLHRMMSTIRHNRARGTHAVLRMAEIVRRMVADGVPEREIQKRLGMEREEIVRLVNRAGMPAQAGGGGFNRAWVPVKE
jgi:ParB-like chromosome segregation protein Spo0J